MALFINRVVIGVKKVIVAPRRAKGEAPRGPDGSKGRDGQGL